MSTWSSEIPHRTIEYGRGLTQLSGFKGRKVHVQKPFQLEPERNAVDTFHSIWGLENSRDL